MSVGQYICHSLCHAKINSDSAPNFPNQNPYIDFHSENYSYNDNITFMVSFLFHKLLKYLDLSTAYHDTKNQHYLAYHTWVMISYTKRKVILN